MKQVYLIPHKLKTGKTIYVMEDYVEGQTVPDNAIVVFYPEVHDTPVPVTPTSDIVMLFNEESMDLIEKYSSPDKEDEVKVEVKEPPENIEEEFRW